MERQELQALWNRTNERLDRAWSLNYQLLREVKFDKTQNELRKFRNRRVAGLVVGHLLNILLIVFLTERPSLVQFLVPGIVAIGINTALIIWNTYQVSLVGQLNWDQPILGIQKKLLKIRISKLRSNRFMFVMCMVQFWALFVVILGWDLVWIWNNVQLWVLINGGLVLVWFPVAAWLLHKYDHRDPKSTFWNKMGNESALTPESVSKPLNQALGVLAEIEAFEKEAA